MSGASRRIGRTLLAALLAVCLGAAAGPTLAVEPGEMLSDPAQEARARQLSQGLRCLVCRNENIDESDADLARELRLLVRDRIRAGDSDDEVMAYLVDRYGEFVLLQPDARGANLILWIAGPAMLLAGLGVAGWSLSRRRGAGAEPEALTEAERARLDRLLGD